MAADGRGGGGLRPGRGGLRGPGGGLGAAAPAGRGRRPLTAGPLRGRADLRPCTARWPTPDRGETVVRGFEHVVDAFLGMLRGANTGKMIVQLAEAP
ncbi:hypothetical protein GCM10010505_74830 [Kitasatospora aburaviensis]